MFLGEGSPFPPTNEVRTLFARPDGGTLEEGDQFRNPDYAQTLQRIAAEGPRALYQGTIAAAIVKAIQREPLPGTMTLKDLAGYHTSFSPPLCRPYPRLHRVRAAAALQRRLAAGDARDPGPHRHRQPHPE